LIYLKELNLSAAY